MKQLDRHLGLFAAISVSLGTMIGGGIFVLPGLATGITGPSVSLAYVIAGLLVLPAALSKAELATAVPYAGGTYLYIERSFGPVAGTIAGLGLWLSLLLKSSFALVALGAYLSLVTGIPMITVALAILSGVVLLNVMGVRKTGQFQLIVVSIVLVSLAIVSVSGLAELGGGRFDSPFPRGATGLIEAIGFVFVSYAGVTKIAAIAEEVRNPSRNLPLAMLLSLGLMTLLYGLVGVVLVGVVPFDSLIVTLTPVADLSRQLFGEVGLWVAVLIATLALTSMANAGVLAASRFPFAMSRDKLLPAALHTVNPTLMTPVRAIIITGLTMSVVILTLDVAKIAKLASAFTILLFCVVNLSVIVLRESGSAWYRPSFRSPLYPVIQIAGIASGLIVLGLMGAVPLVGSAALVVLGLVLYLIYGRRTAPGHKGALQQAGQRMDLLKVLRTAVEEAEPPSEPGRPEVLVPLYDRSPPEPLVALGAALAGEHRLALLQVVEVPEQLELATRMPENPLDGALRRRAVAMASQLGANSTFDSALCRDLRKRVSMVVHDSRPNWVVFTWRQRRRYSVFVRRPMAWMFEHLPCNVALFKDAGVRVFERILVYAQPGPHDAMTAHVADRLARLEKATITFVGFTSTSQGPEEERSVLAYQKELIQRCRAPAEPLVVRGENRLSTLAELAAHYDLLVLGAPQYRPYLSALFGSFEDNLTARAPLSVLRIRTPVGRAHQVLKPDAERVVPGPFQLSDFAEVDTMRARIPLANKETLFLKMAEVFERAHGGSVAELEAAFWYRERQQNTSMGLGLAMPHATVGGLERTYLGLFTLAEPIDYYQPGEQRIDIVLFTVGPPDDCNTHLELLASMARMSGRSKLLERLRKATTTIQLHDILLDCDQQVQTETGVDTL